MSRTSNIDGIWLYWTKAAISIEILKNALDWCNGGRNVSIVIILPVEFH